MRRVIDLFREVPLSAWLVLAAAFALRLLILLLTDNMLEGDSDQYDRFARSIAAGNGYPESAIAASGGPTAFFPPGYPTALAGVYAVTGDSLTAGGVLECFLGAALVAVIGIVAFQVWGRRIAMPAMVVAAAFPPFLFMVTQFASESLFAVLALAAVAALLQHRNSANSYRWAVTAGVLVGLATLTRANGIVLLIPLALGAFRGRPRWSRQAVGPALALITAAVVVISPWTIRNAVVFDRFIPLTTQAQLALARTYNPASQERGAVPQMTPELTRLVRAGNEADVASRAGELGRRYALDHPSYVVEVLARNTARALGFLDGPEIARGSSLGVGANLWLRDAATYSFYLLGALALVGAFLRAARQAAWWLWLVPILLWLSVAWLAAGRMRYRVPVDPFVIFLASLAVVDVWERIRRRTSHREANSPA